MNTIWRVMRLGAHVSVAGGLYKAFSRGEGYGCGSIQIFTKSARTWKAKPLGPGDIDAFKTARSASPVRDVAAHDSYLINLASPDPEQWEKSLTAFIVEVERANTLGLDALVMHPGSFRDSDPAAGIGRVVEAFSRTLDAVGSVGTRVLVENTAGMGTGLGSHFDQVGAILDGIGEDRVFGGCLDTCHAFDAGYDIPGHYDEVIGEYDSAVGLGRLSLFHLNDSKNELGSHRDRHEHIGEGHIGRNGFEPLVNDTRFRDTPGILETPPLEDGTDSFASGLLRLRSYVRGEDPPTRKSVEWGPQPE